MQAVLCALASHARWLARLRRPRSRVFIVCDPGPDPDDVKVLVIACMLHLRGEIDLVGVIANGGHNAQRRAQLARLVLDRLGAREVPVAVGMPGSYTKANDYEFSLLRWQSGVPGGPGEEESGRQFQTTGAEGQMLLSSCVKDCLADDSRQRLTLVIQAGMMDVAFYLQSSAQNQSDFRSAVERVVIQGSAIVNVDSSSLAGPAAATTFTLQPDDSSNNAFDPDAAAFLYRFLHQCASASSGGHQRPAMTLVGRDAVPPISINTVRSCVGGPPCSISRYLSSVQDEGLASLWTAVCSNGSNGSGRLPARCNREWYWQTFCAHLEPPAGGLASIPSHSTIPGSDCGIRAFLKEGVVKPYDVVAFMAALPCFKQDFKWQEAAQVTGPEEASLIHRFTHSSHCPPRQKVEGLVREALCWANDQELTSS